ncbi:MAG TPA: AgmX/PglI C-terminal domain-containing protein [Polyangiaceae bacterium]|jgi:hypothetical protein
MSRLCRKVWFFSLAPLTLLACEHSGKSPVTPSSEAASAPQEPADSPPPEKKPEATQQKPDEEGWEGEESGGGPKDASSHSAAPKRGEETRTTESIQKLVLEQRKPVRKCYEDARKKQPDLQGDMIIHFVLDPKGKVKTAELDTKRSTIKAQSVADCAISVIKQIQFPPSSRGMETNVDYPYNFKP